MKSILHFIICLIIFNLIACDLSGGDGKKDLLPLLILNSMRPSGTGVRAIEPDPTPIDNKCSCGLKSPDGSTFSAANSLKNSLSQNHAEKLSYVPGEVIIKFKQGINESTAKSVMKSMNFSEVKNIPLSRKTPFPLMKKIKLSDTISVEKAVIEYSKNPAVEYAQPNYIYKALGMPNDPNFESQWALHNSSTSIDIDAPEAWDTITDCSSVIVAVLDSGVNYNHRDIQNNMWNGGVTNPNHGFDFIDNDNDPMDLNGHGTHVAGIIGGHGNDATGITGVCWKVQIMAVRILDHIGMSDTATIVQGINFAINNGAHIINASFGASEPDTAMRDAIELCRNHGILFIAAAGNNNNDADVYKIYPACFDLDNIISVAAVDKDGTLANFSNYGKTSVDIGAPGFNIISTWTGQQVTTVEDFSKWYKDTGWGIDTYTYGTSPNDIELLMLTNPADWYQGYYSNNMTSFAWGDYELKAYGASTATVHFFLDYNTELNYDELYFVLNPYGGVPDMYFENLIFSGNSNGLFYTGIDLTFFQSPRTSLGFLFITDSSNNNRGVGIGRFEVNRLYLNRTACLYESGTSMAAPHVAGVAALLKAYRPGATYSEIKNAIFNGAVPLTSLNGRTVTGKMLNAKGALDQI